MKKILVLAFSALVISACNSNSENNTKNSDTIQTSELTDLPIITPGAFDTIAGKYVDKEVQVKGVVEHVCTHSGKKLFLADDKGSVRIESEEKFNDSLIGSKLIVIGIVREFRVDEAYCQQQENEVHKGNTKEEKETCETVKKKIAHFRDSMKTAKVDHISFYSMDFKSLKTFQD